MDRRRFVQSLAVPLAAGRGAPPNLLFVFSDEHRACSMPGEPYNEAHAPNLQRLASQGVSFRNCLSNYPVCSPYRAMLLTGRWPYETGITDNALPLGTSEVSLAHTFGARGYRTGYIGKWHLTRHDDDGGFIPPGPLRQGFDDWHVWSDTNRHFDRSFTYDPETGARIQPRGYNATLMTDTALRFIGENRAHPWMLMLSWNPPHGSWADAPAREMQRYDPAALRFRPNVPSPGARLRRDLQGYYAHITAMDAELGRLLDRLDETGQSSNTIVVYTSDHGDMMGAHGYGGKRLPHDESCRVPLIVCYPGKVPAGISVESLIATIDLYPTLCGLAGVPVPRHCRGSDLSGAARGRPARSPESVFLMHIAKEQASGGANHPAPLFRGVRTARHTYAVAADGRWLLFDNREDPYQMRNLVGDPAYGRLAGELDGVLLERLRKARDPFPLPRSRGSVTC